MAGWWVKKIGAGRFEPLDQLDTGWSGTPHANWVLADGKPTFLEGQGVFADVSRVQTGLLSENESGELLAGVNQGRKNPQLRSTRGVGGVGAVVRTTYVGRRKLVQLIDRYKPHGSLTNRSRDPTASDQVSGSCLVDTKDRCDLASGCPGWLGRRRRNE